MFLHVAHWNILALAIGNSADAPADPERASLQPRFGGAFVVDARATLRVVDELDDTKTGVSSSLHSLNTEFGAARVAALPRAAWCSGCSWPTAPGATALLLPLLI
jgi:hypothetical protein